jgi:protein SCO1/2
MNQRVSVPKPSWRLVFAIMLVSIALELRAAAAEPEAPAPTADPGLVSLPSGESAAQRYFTDVQLTNQDGKHLRFYTDLLQGKVVVINSFFSGCTAVCKVTMPLFCSLQEKFAARTGRDLHLISISVDPEADSPAALKRYATGLGARTGWDFLTGDKQSVELVLRKLGFATEAKEGHSNIFIVGNESTGLWKKVLGIGSPGGDCRGGGKRPRRRTVKNPVPRRQLDVC